MHASQHVQMLHRCCTSSSCHYIAQVPRMSIFPYTMQRCVAMEPWRRARSDATMPWPTPVGLTSDPYPVRQCVIPSNSTLTRSRSHEVRCDCLATQPSQLHTPFHVVASIEEPCVVAVSAHLSYSSRRCACTPSSWSSGTTPNPRRQRLWACSWRCSPTT